MQFFQITESTKLSDIAAIVGARNVDHLLTINGLTRSPNIGKQFQALCNNIKLGQADNAKQRAAVKNVDWQRKSTLLNSFCQDSDVFEAVALSSESAWRVVDALGTLPMFLKVPESVKLPDATYILGNGVGVSKPAYNAAMKMLSTPPHYIDPVIFNEYSSFTNISLIDTGAQKSIDVFEWFHIPWGDVSLHCSIDDSIIDFPVYPEEYEDTRMANYTTMPDLIYQYEPWQIYTGSGPRQNKYSFSFHRDMWSGDHRDGKANQLIRFCEACCYPEFNGSAINVPISSLYVKGKCLMSGVMLDCTASWDGPIGMDGWYLHCTLTFTIVEVSPQALNHSVIKNKPLIG